MIIQQLIEPILLYEKQQEGNKIYSFTKLVKLARSAHNIILA